MSDKPRSANALDTLEAAAKQHLEGGLDALSWGEKCDPRTIIMLCAQLRILKKHEDRLHTNGQLF